MTRFNFIGPLQGEMFHGLTNLTSLDLSFSYFESINLDAFEYLKNLRNLTMTSCVGFDVFPSQSLRGPNKLEIIDLSSTKFVPQDTVQSQDSKPENDFPLSNIKMLNLSDSLINLDDAMEILGLSLMYNLSEVTPIFFFISSEFHKKVKAHDWLLCRILGLKLDPNPDQDCEVERKKVKDRDGKETDLS